MRLPFVMATVDVNGKSTAKSLAVLSDEVTSRLRQKVGNQVEVLNVIIPLVSFDKTTQDKINDYQAELPNTRIARQRQQTADAEAEATASCLARSRRTPTCSSPNASTPSRTW